MYIYRKYGEFIYNLNFLYKNYVTLITGDIVPAIVYCITYHVTSKR